MEQVKFTARDGYPLSGQIFHPDSPVKGGVLITGGTGFKARYYHPLARALAAEGFVALTYDCRGIGNSAPEDLAQLKMRYWDWGKYDMPAALDALASAAEDTELLHIGHSVGGHFVGFWDNHDKISAHLFVCVGSGEIAARPWWRNPMELFFWHGLGPASIRKHGFVKQGKLWGGASLPRGVFEDWKTWCHTKGYYTDDLQGPLKPHFFEEVTSPITSMVYTDDYVATPHSAEFMLNFYPNSTSELRIRKPSDYGIKAIGHDGPFSDRKASARQELIDWCLTNC